MNRKLASKVNPELARAYFNWAVSLGNAGKKPEMAIDCLKTVIDLNPDLAKEVNLELARAYFNWGVSLGNAGKQREAERAFRDAARLDSSMPSSTPRVTRKSAWLATLPSSERRLWFPPPTRRY